MPHDLDEFDRRILREVQRDSSRPVTQLAEAVGLSQAPCWRRLHRLKEEGYIAGEIALLDRKRLGWDLELFVQVKLASHGPGAKDAFTAAMRNNDQVIGCYVLLGSIDIMVHVVARDVADYERFLFELLALGVQEAITMTVLTEIKRTTAVPV